MIKTVAAQHQTILTRSVMLTDIILYISNHLDVSGKMLAHHDHDHAIDEALKI